MTQRTDMTHNWRGRTDMTHNWRDTQLTWHTTDVTHNWCDTQLTWHTTDVTHNWCDTQLMWHITDVNRLVKELNNSSIKQFMFSTWLLGIEIQVSALLNENYHTRTHGHTQTHTWNNAPPPKMLLANNHVTGTSVTVLMLKGNRILKNSQSTGMCTHARTHTKPNLPEQNITYSYP